MKKMFFLAATAALALSSCSSDELVQEQPVAEDGAVVFSAQTLRGTRAYTAENIDLAGLQAAGSPGFGVFAYEQGRAMFSTYNTSVSYPNFMYNQQVLYATDKWTYSPVKYYSNNEGAKHSFFAYAPWQGDGSAVFALGKAPQIRYNTDQNYDLLWSEPVLNKEKAGVSETINFNFKHALSKVNFSAVPFIDEVHTSAEDGHGALGVLATGTTVTVNSIRFVGNVPSQALLNLETGDWTIESTQESAYLIDVTDMQWVGDDNACDPVVWADAKAIKVIPAENIKIEVVYDVVTVDDDHHAGNNTSTVTNKVVSKESYTFEPGKSYVFQLDLGLTSVNFDVIKVSDWEDAGSENVDIPNNHDFTQLPLAVVSATVTPAALDANFKGEHAVNPDNSAYATGTYYYYNTIEKVVYTCSGTAAWAKTTTAVVWYDATNHKYYNVATDGSTTIHSGDYVLIAGSYYNGATTPALTITNALYSLTPASDGYVLAADGTWIAPKKNKYYTLGSALYLWVGEDVPENDARQ